MRSDTTSRQRKARAEKVAASVIAHDVREAVRESLRRAGMDERAASVVADSLVVASETAGDPSPEAERQKQELLAGVERYTSAIVAELAEVTNKPKGLFSNVGESKSSGYTGSPMGDAAHDLNALAATLGLTFEQAAAKLTDAALAASDPLRRARRVVRSFERRRAKNPDAQAGAEVLEAFSIINRDSYQRRKTKASKLAM